MAQGAGEHGIGHGAILQAVSDMRADLRRAEDSREATELRLFQRLDEVQGEVSQVKATVARMDGERSGERNARAEAAGHLTPAAAPGPPSKEQHLTGWQKAAVYATVIGGAVGILGGFGNALHVIATTSVAVYQALKPPTH